MDTREKFVFIKFTFGDPCMANQHFKDHNILEKFVFSKNTLLSVKEHFYCLSSELTVEFSYQILP